MSVQLPSWATLDELKGEIRVDVSRAYPAYLQALGEEATAYLVGGIRLCITRDIAALFDGQEVPVVRFLAGVANDREAVRQQWKASSLLSRTGQPYTDKEKADGVPAKDDDEGFRNGGNTVVPRMRAIRAAKAMIQE